jgi:hypothetical protein
VADPRPHLERQNAAGLASSVVIYIVTGRIGAFSGGAFSGSSSYTLPQLSETCQAGAFVFLEFWRTTHKRDLFF